MASGFSLARRLRDGETVYAAWCRLAVPVVSELLARQGFIAVTFDQQHGLFDFSTTAASIMAVQAAGSAAVVRIPVGDNATASRMLDAGADAVIAPMINTPEDARAFADVMKYPPVGTRSWGPHRAIPLSGLNDTEYLRDANDITLSFAMIETRTAFRNIMAIIDTPGIDGIFVGPSDLSITFSNGATQNPSHPEVDGALDVIAGVASSRGKIAGVHCTTAERALELSQRGFRFLGVASDLGLLSLGAATVKTILNSPNSTTTAQLPKRATA